MRNSLVAAVTLLSVITGAQAIASSVVSKCVDGSRSMTVVQSADGSLKGQFVGFNGSMNMSCQKIQGTKTLKCVSGQYYVLVFNHDGRQLVQLNLFGEDGYLYSLNCKE